MSIRLVTTFRSVLFNAVQNSSKMLSSSSSRINPSVYPLARKDEKIVDNYHGTKIFDPYRWLEEPKSEETKKFIKSLNSISQPFLESAPSREIMRKELTERWNYEKYGCPLKHGAYYYYFHNSGLQNQYVLYQQESLSEKSKVFFDPNALNPNGTTSLSTSSFSNDGQLWAYGLSENGADWMTIKFKTCEGKDLDDVIPDIKHTGVSWMKDNSGVFYSKYPDHKGETEGTSVDKHEFHSIYFHKLGTDATEDILVYERRDDPDIMMGGHVTLDGRFLIISVYKGCDPCNQLFFYDLEKNREITGPICPTPLFDKFDAKYIYVDHDETSMLIQTTKDSPMYRLVKFNLNNPSELTEVIPEQENNKLQWAAPIPGDRLLLEYLEDVKSSLYVYSNTGSKLYQIPLPIGSIGEGFVKKTEDEVFLGVHSFTIPGITFRINFGGLDISEKPNVEELRRITLAGLDQDQFNVQQIFYPSKDGTKIPMYIVGNKDIKKDGSNPVLLNGYGGFSIPFTPYFSLPDLVFIKKFGAIVATANLRGGGEYGEKWHEAGMKQHKQNVFDDMACAAEFLIREGYTTPEKLAIQGGSNGGLLVAACSQQRPELYGAVINQVGVLDMLRFHRFTAGSAWVPEYGNPDDPEDFNHLIKYSPLHRLEMPEQGQWPSTLLCTADHDDRVVPSHTLKYVATLYEKAKKKPDQTNPLLAKIEVEAGHGGGKPMKKVIDEFVDQYSFLERTLRLKWQE